MVFGYGSVGFGNFVLVFGKDVSVDGFGSVLVGVQLFILVDGSVVIGFNVEIGFGLFVFFSVGVIVIGENFYVIQDGSVVIGRLVIVNVQNVVVLGVYLVNFCDNMVLVGDVEFGVVCQIMSVVVGMEDIDVVNVV